jgi:hypothetical protein
MADPALENALRKRDELAVQINKAQQQIDEWKRELAHTDTFISAWHEFAGTSPEAIPLNSPPRSNVAPVAAKRKSRNNSKKEDVAAEVRRLIEAEGHPVPRVELYKALIENGFVIDGTDPDMVLSTMLWRAGKAAGVVRLDKGGYWLAEREYPEARYFPTATTELTEPAHAEGPFDELLGGNGPQDIFR